MGVSLPGTLVRTGEERATLVRRTYGLVFISVIVTALGVAFGFTQPALMEAVARHPIITMLACSPRSGWRCRRGTRSREIWPSRSSSRSSRGSGSRRSSSWPSVRRRASPARQVCSPSRRSACSRCTPCSASATSARGEASSSSALWVLIATSLINMFVGSALGSIWIAGGTVLVFSGLLVFDTWRIVRSGQYGPDDYVPAAVNIYLDLLNLFLAIVSAARRPASGLTETGCAHSRRSSRIRMTRPSPPAARWRSTRKREFAARCTAATDGDAGRSSGIPVSSRAELGRHPPRRAEGGVHDARRADASSAAGIPTAASPRSIRSS